jgi:phage major head subunit gpT-like protein
MGLNASALSAANTAFNVAFREALKDMTGQNSQLAQMAEVVTLTTKTTVFPIKGTVARMREWVGPRMARQLQNYGFSATAAKYEDTVEVNVTDIEDDQYGLYTGAFADLGDAASYLPWDSVMTKFKAGSTDLCYDGVAYFSASHPKNPFDGTSDVQANLSTSKSLNATNLASEVTAMTQLTDGYGNLLRVRPTHLVVPEALRKTGRELVEMPTHIVFNTGSNENYAAAPANALQGTLQLMVLPDLDGGTNGSATSWYLADYGKRLKPFFWGWRTRPVMQPPSMNQHAEFNEDKLVYGVRARGAAGYGMWQLVRKMTA